MDDAPAAEFPLLARVPGWCGSPRVELNGKPLEMKPERGFARIVRVWKKGDVLRLTFSMKPSVEIAYPAKDDNTIIGNAAEPVLDPASVPGAQVVRKAMPAVWDWPLDAPVKVVAKDSAGRPLELVPYGCTKLRVSMFPVE